jgi:GST-like protein
MLDLHFWPTPNGKKVTILLEELGLDYNLVPCNIGRGDQFKPEFLEINPNHRMPVLVDHDPKGGCAAINVFESGAIMMYLAEKEGRFWPQDLRGKYDVVQWVICRWPIKGQSSANAAIFAAPAPRRGISAMPSGASPTRRTGSTG